MGKRIVLLVGKSGSGKSTIAKKLEDDYGLSQVLSYTTRPIRDGEIDNPTHTFVTDEEFNELTNLVGYTEFNGYKYCATSQQIDDNDIYVIDPDGVEYMREHYSGNKEVVVVYINCPDSVLMDRMLERGDDFLDAFERFQHDRSKFAKGKKMANYVYDNIDRSSLVWICEKIFRIVVDT